MTDIVVAAVTTAIDTAGAATMTVTTVMTAEDSTIIDGATVLEIIVTGEMTEMGEVVMAAPGASHDHKGSEAMIGMGIGDVVETVLTSVTVVETTGHCLWTRQLLFKQLQFRGQTSPQRLRRHLRSRQAQCQVGLMTQQMLRPTRLRLNERIR